MQMMPGGGRLYDYMMAGGKLMMGDEGLKMVTNAEGKRVPFFAADGIGKMEAGGKMRGYKIGQEGIEIDTDPPKKGGPYTRTVETADAEFESREGMMQAGSKEKLDAYNFNVPAGGFDTMSKEEQERLKNTPFGREYLSGSGSMDDQYRAYAAKVNNFINNEPEKALAAANKMLESGNDNFARALKGKTDEEKLSIMKQYMTDKKIGDFHGALKFMEKEVPTSQFYNPNPAVSGAGFRGAKFPMVLNAVGKRQVKPGDISKLAKQAEAQGIDLSKETEESMSFVSKFMDEFGSQDRAEDYTGEDNQFFIDQAEKGFESGMKSRKEQADERRRKNQALADAMKRMAKGGKIEYGMSGMKVGKRKRQPTEEEAERGVVEVKRDIFGRRVEKFGDGVKTVTSKSGRKTKVKGL